MCGGNGAGFELGGLLRSPPGFALDLLLRRLGGWLPIMPVPGTGVMPQKLCVGGGESSILMTLSLAPGIHDESSGDKIVPLIVPKDWLKKLLLVVGGGWIMDAQVGVG